MTRRRRAALAGLVLCLGAVLLLGRCSTLPPLEPRTVSTALFDTAATRLGRAVARRAAAHPGLSGIHPLPDARDAFAARCLLARAAERTLDVQYYIWHRDLSGTLLGQALVEAADRGVRVRFLMDDNSTAGLDETLAALDAHPNIEVRLFNPLAIRKPRLLGYLDFARVNRRMHNKSFTADSQATIVGGRNVGDEYFGATDGMLFADLDVLAVGPVVREVSRDFDRYWASALAYPAGRLLPPASPAASAEIRAAAERIASDPAAVAYLSALHGSPFVHQLMAGTLPLEWAPTRMVSDDPAKALGRARRETLLFHQLQTILGAPAERVDLVSPYFIPTGAGVDLFTEWARRGVAVRVLTNSLEATDVAAVHAGYAKSREALLAAGIELHELRLMPGGPPAGRAGSVRSGGRMGSSGSSLHAKTFAVDGARVFIGSFNFDPRSAELNTEMGFVIDSPDLARRISEVLDRALPSRAYQPRLSEAGELYWLEHREGREPLRHDSEPGAGFWRRAVVRVVSWFPVERLL